MGRFGRSSAWSSLRRVAMCPLRYVLVMLSLLVLGITLFLTGGKSEPEVDDDDLQVEGDEDTPTKTHPKQSRMALLWEMSCGIWLYKKFKEARAVQEAAALKSE